MVKQPAIHKHAKLSKKLMSKQKKAQKQYSLEYLFENEQTTNKQMESISITEHNIRALSVPREEESILSLVLFNKQLVLPTCSHPSLPSEMRGMGR